MRDFLCFFLIAVLAASCSKKEPDLLPATQEGRNTIAFRTADGVYFAEGDKPGFGGFLSYYKYAYGYVTTDSSLYIHGENEDEDQHWDLVIRTDGSSGGRHYDLAALRADVTFKPVRNGNTWYKLDTIAGGRVDITYHSSTVLAGTFDIHLVAEGSGRKLHITEGRFDIGPQ